MQCLANTRCMRLKSGCNFRHVSLLSIWIARSHRQYAPPCKKANGRTDARNNSWKAWHVKHLANPAIRVNGRMEKQNLARFIPLRTAVQIRLLQLIWSELRCLYTGGLWFGWIYLMRKGYCLSYCLMFGLKSIMECSSVGRAEGA